MNRERCCDNAVELHRAIQFSFLQLVPEIRRKNSFYRTESSSGTALLNLRMFSVDSTCEWEFIKIIKGESEGGTFETTSETYFQAV